MFSSFSFMKTVQSVSSQRGPHGGNVLQDEDIDILVSPVPHLLKSNDPPSDEERDQINQILLITSQRLEKLQNRLLGTANTLMGRKDKDSTLGRGQLQKSITFAQSLIQAHESIKSCLRSFPVEIIRLIFIQCLPDLEDHNWDHHPWDYGFPFTLSHICSRWRQIAHDTPQLWSVIGKIKLNPKTAKKGRYTTFYFLDEFLRRSRNQGIRLDISAHFMEYMTPCAHPIIQLVLQHAERWEVVTIASTWPTIASLLYHSTHSGVRPFSRLRRLGLEVWKQYSEAQESVQFKGAPMLEDLFVSGYPPNSLDLPLNGLKRYRECLFGNADPGFHLCKVLDQSRQVQRLEIVDLVGFDDNFWFPNHNAPLNHLSVVHLKMREGFSGNWGSVETLFDRLTLPALTELKVAGFPGAEVVSKLTSILHHSHCVLRTLCLSTSDAFPRDLDRLLELTPKLEELDVDIPSMMDMFILGVGNSSFRHGKPMIPQLKRLTLRFTSPNSIENCASLLSLIAHLRFNHPLGSTGDGDNSAVEVGSPADRVNGSVSRNEVDNRTWFRLVFSDHDTASAAQIHLYSCAKVQNVSLKWGSGDAEYLNTFMSWRSKLNEELPELCGMPAPGKRRLDFGFSHRLNKLLAEIESFEPFQCLVLPSLLTSKIHHSLHNLTFIRPGHIPGESTFNYYDRSIALLAKWEGFIQNDMRNVGWALMGQKSLVYIPDSDPLRGSRRIFDMIYGMEDHVRNEDLDWMDHM